jgi:hypothetical protein
MPIRRRQGATTVLRIGSGPRRLALSAPGTNQPSISDLRMTVENALDPADFGAFDG